MSMNQDFSTSGTGQTPAVITEKMSLYLKQTKPWVRFISIVMFVAVGLMVLVALFMMVGMGFIGNLTGQHGGKLGGFALGAVLGALYLLIALLYFFPGLYLFQYASAIGRMLKHDQTGGMEQALQKQKSFWKFIGIMLMIILCIYAIAIIVVGGLAIFGALKR